MHSKLPHINLHNHHQFITFRTKESIDSYVTTLQNSDISTKQKQYEIDKYLDNSSNGAYFDRAFMYIVNNPIKANLKDVRVFSKYEL